MSDGEFMAALEKLARQALLNAGYHVNNVKNMDREGLLTFFEFLVEDIEPKEDE